MKIKTINLTGEETKAELNRAYAFIEINNSSDGEILISKEPGIVRGNDDVAILPAKNIVTIGDAGSSTGIKEIYISGKGEIQIIGKDFAEHCFKIPASGGGSDVDPTVDFLPYPEGIYGYWDFLSGMSEKVWTGKLNNTKINIIADVNNVFETNEEGVYITAPPNSNSVNIAPVGMLNESNKIFYLGYKDNSQGTNWNCLPFGEGGPKDNNLPKWNLNSYNNKPALWVSNNKHIYSNIDALSKFVAVAIMAYEGTASLFVNDKFIGTSTDLNRLFADYSLSCGVTYKYFMVQEMTISYNEIIENNKSLSQKYGIEI